MFSPSADLDLILPRFLARIGDAVGDSLLPSSESCSLVTALEDNSLLVRNKQNGSCVMLFSFKFVIIFI